mmetsp:Transcript_36154/g.78139  ORF Transcript_36154/g.78139 Transcript_36154/m.78139 type:complete len:395 (+) Transcript_36154:297-1481(+)
MVTAPRDGRAHRGAMQALAVSLVGPNCQVEAEIVGREGGVSLVVAGMRRFHSSAPIAAAGCAALAAFAVAPTLVNLLPPAGGLEAVVLAMTRHANVSQVQASGCAAVARVAAASPELKAAAVHAGCPLVVLRALQLVVQRRETGETRDWACAAMASLADHPDAKAVGAAASEPLVAVIREGLATRGGSEVGAMRALSAVLLGASSGVLRPAVAAGAVEVAVEAVESAVRGVSDPLLLAPAAATLCAAADNREARRRMAAVGAAGHLLRAVVGAEGGRAEAVLVMALGLWAKVVEDPDVGGATRADLVAGGAIEASIGAMRALPTSTAVAAGACLLVYLLCVEPRAAQRALAAGGEAAMREALAQHGGGAEVVRTMATGALTRMQSDRTRQAHGS